MIELFIEITDLVFWEGYTEQLSREYPERFSIDFNEFLNTYQFWNYGTSNKFQRKDRKA
ncbi:hypothetical protein [Daejeonella sp. JGW-45]|uniref:hypothetical protein n=1 Tax=Daejeonella sp. JGW-45 TaxID=3034148 RepID=UPI0023ED6EF5|nr:hypothetical protein [Daejeonella sp. JGW-45]